MLKQNAFEVNPKIMLRRRWLAVNSRLWGISWENSAASSRHVCIGEGKGHN